MNLFEHFISGKLECSECISDLCIGKIRIVIRNLIKNGLIIMKYVMFLVVITNRHFGSKCEFALIRCDNLINDL